jgi:ABC-2 type transport system permease protein
MTGLSPADMPQRFIALCGELSGEECAQYFIISQFLLLFMLIPLAIPVTIASYSVVGEKSTRTLEPVMATPITTAEFLTGRGLAAVNVALMVSSRANDPRVAEQLSMIVVLPLLGRFFGRIAGLVIINLDLILWLAVALAGIDAGLIAFAVQLFQRESILTRWK